MARQLGMECADECYLGVRQAILRESGATMEQALDLGVVIRLEGEADRAAGEACRRICQLAPTESVLDQSHLAHVTLFQGRFPGAAQDQVFEALARLRSCASPFDIELLPELTVSAAGNVFWPAARTPELLQLHRKSIEAFRPLTQGLLLPQFQDLLEDPHADLARIERYGMSEAGSRFEPHVTLCRLSHAERDGDRVAALGAPSLHFAWRRLALGELGYHGNVKRVAAQESG